MNDALELLLNMTGVHYVLYQGHNYVDDLDTIPQTHLIPCMVFMSEDEAKKKMWDYSNDDTVWYQLVRGYDRKVMWYYDEDWGFNGSDAQYEDY